MAEIKSLCVYCGSRDGATPGYARIAREIGKILAERGISLVYGGGSVGMMGHMARSVLAEGGHVIGIIPSHLDEKEITFEKCSELHVVGSMHTRKKMMFDMADGFLVLPGGVGTMEEMVEVGTWRQLRLHEKPIVVLNISGFWKPFIQMLNIMVQQQFAGDELQDIFKIVSTVDEVMPAFDDADDPWLESESSLF